MSFKECPKLFFAYLVMFILIPFVNLFAQGEIEIGKAMSEFDRGVGDGTRKAKYEEDLERIESFYDDCAEQKDYDKEEASCLNIFYHHKSTKQECTCNPQVDPPDCAIHCKAITEFFTCMFLPTEYPYRQYWMAFQKGEQVQVPFSSAFMTKGIIEEFMAKSEEILYAVAPSLMVGTGDGGPIDHLNEASEALGWGMKLKDDGLREVTEEVVNELTAFDRAKYRFRNAIPRSGGYRYMVGHIFSTRFHETYKMEDRYNMFPSTDGYNWIHTGAKNTGPWLANSVGVLFGLGSMAMDVAIPVPEEKPEIPDWMSEMPLGNAFSGMLLNYFYGPVRKYFADAMFPQGSTNNCMLMRMNRPGEVTDKTPEDIISDDHRKALDVDNPQREQLQYCLPGMHGAKFGFPLAIVDTTYGTVADNVAFYRNLKVAKLFEKELGGEYHDLQEVDGEGGHLRDRIQFLMRKHFAFKKGCSPFKGFNHFIPDISGPEYGEANNYVNRPEGEYFRSVHWRYVRGCPVNPGLKACYYPGVAGGEAKAFGMLCKDHDHEPKPTSVEFILK